MKKVIYFFSGTGNSLRAARIIADELKDTGIVNVRNDPSGYSAEDAEVIGFVCPVYEWDIPGRMKAFISELNVNPMPIYLWLPLILLFTEKPLRLWLKFYLQRVRI